MTIILTNMTCYVVVLTVIVFVANNYQTLVMKSDLDKGLLVEKLGRCSKK